MFTPRAQKGAYLWRCLLRLPKVFVRKIELPSWFSLLLLLLVILCVCLGGLLLLGGSVCLVILLGLALLRLRGLGLASCVRLCLQAGQEALAELRQAAAKEGARSGATGLVGCRTHLGLLFDLLLQRDVAVCRHAQ